ncbi:MAG: sigma-54-dependent Fis family transcriptional regulator [Deltaproteobacteria bacterium]|nr:MAG: sigma-54-dependent Fis family transcriptional regulator [Deltaproteobacteria bacterium]
MPAHPATAPPHAAPDAAADPGPRRICAMLVDDDDRLLHGLSRILKVRGIDSVAFTDGPPALDRLRAEPDAFDVIVCDVQMPAMNGLDVLRHASQIAPDVPVVMLTADRSAETAVAALKAGAFNYLTKPPANPDEVIEVLSRATAYGRLQRRTAELERRIAVSERYGDLVGASAPMRALFETIEQIAKLDVCVLVTGETGTGKELVARAIHQRSRRAARPFLPLNCGAIPETLVDSELFGHARGAFTGAVEDRAGAFERANGGTLFLDEIGDIAPAVQVRLLRVLQEGEITPVGGSRAVPVDVRVIAATWSDLDEAVEAGQFRADLFYRLNVVSLEVPPLRQRADDIPLLATHFVAKHAARMGRPAPAIGEAAMDALAAYHWPGNVRELENAVQRALALTPGDTIEPAALPPQVTGRRTARRADTDGGDGWDWADGLPYAEARKLAAERFERAYLTRLLRATRGNISEASRRAGVDRSNLRRILTRVGIAASAFRDAAG